MIRPSGANSLVRRKSVAVLALLLFAVTAGQAEAPQPATSGFSEEGLARVSDYLRHEVATGKIPGAVLLIQQHGRPIFLENFGVRDIESKTPMSSDMIFRLYSMSKPVTSVAAMMLVDDGRLSLDDPLSKFIPAFAEAKVAVEAREANGETTLTTEPLARPIRILDLLRHTSGITYGFYGDSPVRKLYAASKLFDGDVDNAELAERLAKLPLTEQPGTLWDYGHSTDILGRVIEVASGGKSLLKFEKEKLLDPLGMTATSFYVTDPAQQKLIAKPMPNDSDFRVGFTSYADVPMKWESGGGGMVSTMADFSRFAQMILDGGKLDGKRYLSAKAFTDMTTDHVGPGSSVGRDYLYFPGDGFGFGLGFGVRTDPGNAKPPPPGDLGELKWDGASGCLFVIDRKQDMYFVLLEQTPSERQKIQPMVKKLIYEAMEN
jgi:CubicO group peptidase (beta-lactamase class C family)